jgi:DNA-binding LacI/PurR family transcriptional regulator
MWTVPYWSLCTAKGHWICTASGCPYYWLIMFGDFGRVSAEHAVYRLLDRRPGLDAVFVASDLMAAGALRALRRSGRRVPEDVAVIGFEDSPLARHADPKLTTVRQPVEAMGERTARADRAGRPRSRARGP